ncbi:MAG: endonuclease, partial [Clostridia bacterium]|nr:endonuclease [Clostridia bacterium]
TCRLLNMPYDPADPATQYYVIDGFILSPNVRLDAVETKDCGFEFSDHNPVMLDVTLLAD